MADTVDKLDTGGGNTKPPPSSTETKASPQHRRWVWTENNPVVDKIDDLLASLAGAAKYVFSLEEGENETPHYQGYIEFKNAKTFNGVKKLLPRAHIAVAKGDWESNLKYCTKAPLKGPWIKGFPEPVKSDIVEFKPWQKKAFDLYLGKPHPRKIHWYWETTGGVGKTALAKHICLRGDALYVSGKAADIKCAIAAWLHEGKPLKAVIWGLPRTSEEYVSYASLEEVKDGIFFNSKYESGMVMYATPHVFVFSNFQPDCTKLSQDRWDIHHIIY